MEFHLNLICCLNIQLLYFQENKRRVFAIVMLVADEKAQADLDAITSSIQIEK